MFFIMYHPRWPDAIVYLVFMTQIMLYLLLSIQILSFCIDVVLTLSINTLRPRQNGHHFADDIFKCIFMKENVWIPFKISLKFIPKDPVNNIPELVQIMAWRRPGDRYINDVLRYEMKKSCCACLCSIYPGLILGLHPGNERHVVTK